jgi:hypothetical protein
MRSNKIWYVYNLCTILTIFFLKKLTFGYVGPTHRKTDPIINFKKKIIEIIQELCQKLYNNHFSKSNNAT